MSLDDMKRELRKRYERLSPSLPRPVFATHCITTKEGFEAVPKQMAIDMAVVGRPVSLSLDGTFAKEMKYYVGFAFDLHELIARFYVKPAIYLSSKGKELIAMDSYYLQRWHFFYEAEILAEGTIPLRLAKWGFPGTEVYPDEVKKMLSNLGIKYRVLLDVPSEFRRKVTSTFNLAQERGVYPAGVLPPPWLQDYLHRYNMMICDIFNLAYPEIREEAKSWQYVEW